MNESLRSLKMDNSFHEINHQEEESPEEDPSVESEGSICDYLEGEE